MKKYLIVIGFVLFVSVSIAALNILSVGRGGTGKATLTANNVLLGNGTSAVQFVAPSTSGNVLTSNGTSWTSAAAGGGGFESYSGWSDYLVTNKFIPANASILGGLAPDFASGDVGNVTSGGVASGLYFYQDTAPGSGEGDTVTVLKNGVATTLTAPIGGVSAKAATDLVHTVTFAAGDRIAIRFAKSSGSALNWFAWHLKLQ